MSYVRLTAIVVLASLVCAMAPADQRRVEVSSDGHVTAELEGPETPGVGFMSRGSSVPYGTTPDWTYNVRRQVGGIRVVDMNGDTLPDVVAAVYNSNSFPPYDDWHNFILYNTGTEPESTPSWVSTDQVSTGNLDVGLINDDEYPDFFAANGNSFPPSVIYFGGPAGPSTSPGWSSNVPNGAWTNYAKIFDINHDGYNDVVTANQGRTNDPFRPMNVFMNNAGTLETVPSWQSAESSIQNYLDFADYDGDGWEDLAVSKWANWQTAIYKNVNGTLQTTPDWTVGNTSTDKGVAWADIDGNNLPDLLVGHDPTQLWTNSGPGTLTLAAWAGNAPFYSYNEMLTADIDGDGDPDLVETHFADGRTHIYLNNNGVLDSSPSWTYDSSAVGAALAVGDIDGNGRLDLVIGYAGDTSIVIFFAEDFKCPADLVAPFGTVDIFDLIELLKNWNTDGNGAAIAEPFDVVNVFDLVALLKAWGDC